MMVEERKGKAAFRKKASKLAKLCRQTAAA
jgi:hypothetical protein